MLTFYNAICPTSHAEIPTSKQRLFFPWCHKFFKILFQNGFSTVLAVYYQRTAYALSHRNHYASSPSLIVHLHLLLVFSCQIMSNSSWPSHGLQHTRLPCPSPTPGACSYSCPWSQWCHPTISSSVALFSSCPQPFPASGTFPMSWLFASDDQTTGASASVLPMSILGWFPLRLPSLISLLSEGLSRVFSSTTIRKHQFFEVQTSLLSSSHILT